MAVGCLMLAALAAFTAGRQGALDGRLTFGRDGSCLVLSGWDVRLSSGRVGTDCPLEKTSIRHAGDGREDVDHVVRLPDARRLTVRASIWVRDDVVRVSWSLPDMQPSPGGEPRFTSLSPHAWSETPGRVFAGMGNVVVDPVRMELEAAGFRLSTRHVGGEWGSGLGVVMATDVFPDRLSVDKAAGVFALTAHNDATFTFVVSAHGAFAAARRFADIAQYRRSAGWMRLAGRTVLDQWKGDYDEAAADLERVAGYGVTNAVFVKHCWQRYGYDFRLPDVCPPAGDVAAFRRMAAAAQRHGTCFCPHDNYTDFYPDAEGYSEDLIVRDREGRTRKAWFNKERNAQSYQWLPHAFGPWLDRNMRQMRTCFAPDGLFIDVLTAKPPFDYLDKDGRYYTARRCAEEWGKAFDRCREMLGRPEGPMISEAGHDALIGHVDAGEADHYSAWKWRKKMRVSEFGDAERVPWHDIVTHGRMVLLGGGLGHRYADSGNAEQGCGTDGYFCTTAIGGRNPFSSGPFCRDAVVTHWLLHDVLEPLAKGEFKSFAFVENDIRRQHAEFDGGEVWVNRSSNAVWKVQGRVLPQDGLLVRSSAGEAGVVLLHDRRVAYSRTDDSLFVDARSPHGDGMPAFASVNPHEGRRQDGDLVIAMDVEALAGSVDGCRPFAHVVRISSEAGSKEQIVCQARRISFARNGFVSIDVGKLPTDREERYEVLLGVTSASGERLPLRSAASGCIGRRSGRLSIGWVDRTGWEPPEAPVSQGCETVDFSAVVTDGTFLLRHPRRGNWQLVPAPGSRRFQAVLDLVKLGAGDRRVRSVVGAADWKANGGKLSLRFGEDAEPCTIRFGGL